MLKYWYIIESLSHFGCLSCFSDHFLQSLQSSLDFASWILSVSWSTLLNSFPRPLPFLQIFEIAFNFIVIWIFFRTITTLISISHQLRFHRSWRSRRIAYVSAFASASLIGRSLWSISIDSSWLPIRWTSTISHSSQSGWFSVRIKDRGLLFIWQFFWIGGIQMRILPIIGHYIFIVEVSCFIQTFLAGVASTTLDTQWLFWFFIVRWTISKGVVSWIISFVFNHLFQLLLKSWYFQLTFLVFLSKEN